MATRSCKVTVRDLQGIDHSVHVTASTLYEAVALGLAALHGEEWVAAIATEPTEVRVSVVSVPVEHSVKLKDFVKWLDCRVLSPKDVIDRGRVREILGLDREKDVYARLRHRNHDRH